MQGKQMISRRNFLRSSGALTGTSLMRIGAPSLLAITQAACSAKRQATAYDVLGIEEAADYAAMAARIIPTTDTPGANDAGVIYFFDRALAAEMSDVLEPLRSGLGALNDNISTSHENASRFSQLSENEQDAMLSGIESGDFFNLVWLMTMFGFFGMSKHGGNKDYISWDLIDFKGRHGAWSYPFGYYDAEYAKAQSDGE